MGRAPLDERPRDAELAQELIVGAGVPTMLRLDDEVTPALVAPVEGRALEAREEKAGDDPRSGRHHQAPRSQETAHPLHGQGETGATSHIYGRCHFVMVTVVPRPTSEMISNSSMSRREPGSPRPRPLYVV